MTVPEIWDSLGFVTIRSGSWITNQGENVNLQHHPSKVPKPMVHQMHSSPDPVVGTLFAAGSNSSTAAVTAAIR